jgi:RNA polymerase sigma-70 factor, ECF subfamily
MDEVILAQKGNDEAFYNLINQRKSVLYKTAFAYLRNQDDAIEIVQETVY